MILLISSVFVSRHEESMQMLLQQLLRFKRCALGIAKLAARLLCDRLCVRRSTNISKLYNDVVATDLMVMVLFSVCNAKRLIREEQTRKAMSRHFVIAH